MWCTRCGGIFGMSSLPRRSALNDNTLVRTIVSSSPASSRRWSTIVVLARKREKGSEYLVAPPQGSQGRWHYAPFNCRRMRGEPARFNALGVSSHAFHADEIASWIKQRGPRGTWNEFTRAHAYVYAVTPIQDHRPTAAAATAVAVASHRSIIHDPTESRARQIPAPSNREPLSFFFFTPPPPHLPPPVI